MFDIGGGRVWRETILHVDMDAFFASIEQRDDPQLRGRPVAVGGSSGRGVVAAASYEARQFGVRSAMPMVRARRQCPQLIVVPPRGQVYRAVSHQVMAILRDVTPTVEPLSMDEAFLDISGLQRRFAGPGGVADQIRATIRAEVDLPCSVGVAATKSVAKLLSAHAKPDGVLHWNTDDVQNKLRPLSVAVLWGIGPKTHALLDGHGIRTVGALVDTDPTVLARLVGHAAAARLRALAVGHDPRDVAEHGRERSLSAETTFPIDITEAPRLVAAIQRLVDDVGQRLRQRGLAGRTVQCKVRTADFVTRTRSLTLAHPVADTATLTATAVELLHRAWDASTAVRLVGVGIHNVAASAQQALPLDNKTVTDLRWRDIDAVRDALQARHGSRAVTFASTLRTGAVQRPGSPQTTGRKRTPGDDARSSR